MADDPSIPGSTPPPGQPPGPPPGPPPSDESLLIAGALQQARRGSDMPDPPERLPPANTFPGYELIREIHRGGQGVVYLALQRATKRKVAIKVLHQGPFAGEKDRQRFEREVEILAQLNHPNIVAVIDSGSTAPPVSESDLTGAASATTMPGAAARASSPQPSAPRPAGVQAQAPGYQGSFFCVMEYISGSPLDSWVKDKKPGIDAILSVFVQICDAVNAAHLKGIIHRDIKPANIRVDHDGKPHVLDFGLARVGIGSTTGGDAPELMTMTGQFIGSLPWASPEQAEGAPEKLDVRTDVYSLGVMLYQMLTDKFPYQVIGMMRDVLDNILRAEPARPSTVRRQINNEVETIVLKCLSKERERRYQNAGDLGRDLGRYLNGEPIEAKRDSGWYVITKTARRHKVAVGVAAGFLLLIIGFGLAMAGLWRDSERQRIAAEAATEAANEATREKAAALLESEIARASSEATRNFLERMLSAVDPTQSRGREVLVTEVLEDAAARIERDAPNQPEVQADIRHIIGATYLSLGLAGDAEPFLRGAFDSRGRTLGPDADHTLHTQALLAHAVGLQGRWDAARELYTSLIASLQRTSPAGSRAAFLAMHDYGVLLRKAGRRDEAIHQSRGAVDGLRALGAADEDLGRAMLSLGEAMFIDYRAENLDEIAPVVEQGAALLSDRLGVDHPHTAIMRVQMARVRMLQGRLNEAEPQFREGLDVLERVLREDDPERLEPEIMWGEFLHRANRLDEAEAVLRSVVARYTSKLGPQNLATAWARANLGSTLNRQGRWVEAEVELRFALDVYREQARDTNRNTIFIARKLAQVFTESGHPERIGELPPGLRPPARP